MSSHCGSELGDLIENISSRMLFTKIVVHDVLNAYKLFETLNARGVQLSTPDLLKNYLFSVITSNDDVPDEEINELDEDWLNILTQLKEHNFSNFIRHQHNIQNTENRNLFRSIKQIANTPQSASQYLKSLTEYAPINQVFPVLMVACKKFSPEEFVKTLKYLYILSVRYNIICRFSPNEQEKAYNKIAIKIFNGEYIRASHIKNSKEFKQLYPDDKVFQNSFEFYKMPSRRSSKKIRFLLTEIENSFGREKTVYLNTSFKLAKKVAEYENWDLATLSHYQTWLAKQAVNTWKIF